MNQFSLEVYLVCLSCILAITLGYPIMDSLCSLARRNSIDFNADELGSYFEGDIIHKPTVMNRNGIVGTQYRWPGATIPYKISSGYDNEHICAIREAMANLESVSCITFKSRSNETDYIKLSTKNNGCASEVGKQGGMQIVNLQKSKPGCGCFKVGTIMHELLHALGFYHMHTDVLRDDFTTVMWENIEPTRFLNFEKYTSSQSFGFGVAYDYGSVMHYSRKAFSTNGKDTIIPLDKNAEIGQRTHLSELDIKKLNKMYNCS